MPYWPEWITFDEEIEIVVEQLNCDRSRAEEIVVAYWSSILPYTLTEMQIKHKKTVRKNFQEWLNRRHPPKRSSHSNRASKTATPDKIDEAWEEYRAAPDNPSMDGWVKFACDTKGLTNREELRKFYRKATGSPGPGRPRKSARK
jgi:hypothetical protein